MSDSGRRQYRISLVCGLVPLATGASVYVLWIWTRWDWLRIAGLLTLLIGSGMFLWGLVATLLFAVDALREGRSGRTVIFLKSVLALAILASNFPAAPAILSDVGRRDRPSVSDDWVKARAYEFLRGGPADLPWPRVGENRWYFADQRFGICLFEFKTGEWTLLMVPDGDGRYAYVLLPDKTLRYSPDDALSMGCEWSQIQSEKPEYYTPSVFSSWRKLNGPADRLRH